MRTPPKESLLLFSWRQGTVLSLKYSQENPHTHAHTNAHTHTHIHKSCQKSGELLAELLLKVICSTESPNRALSLLWSFSMSVSPVKEWIERDGLTDRSYACRRSLTDAETHHSLTAQPWHTSDQFILTDTILRRKYKYHHITGRVSLWKMIAVRARQTWTTMLNVDQVWH